MGSTLVFLSRHRLLVWAVLRDSPWGSRTISPRGGGDSPWGEYIGLPRGGRAPTVGVTFSPVGKRLPLGGWDGFPHREGDSPWMK